MKTNSIVIPFLLLRIALSEAPPMPDTATISSIDEILQSEIRGEYPSLLSGANLLYLANIELQDRLVAYFFHKSTTGSFMSVASYYYGSQKTKVNTLVRLGKGYSGGLELDEQNGPTLLSIPEFTSIVIPTPLTEQIAPNISSLLQEEIKACGDSSDQKLRQDYDQYLRDAVLTNSMTLKQSSRGYEVLTYLSNLGSFMVITQCKDGKIEVSSFVRLAKKSLFVNAQ